MKTATVLVLGEGPHELGPKGNWGRPVSAPQLPALPVLVNRVLGPSAGLSYVCRHFGPEARSHGKGMRQAIGEYASHRYALNVVGAVLKAQLDGQDAVVVLIDRDRRPNQETVDPLRAGRDAAARESSIPCAVGVAAETFDAWMIADGKAVAEAGGDASRSHPSPENLNGKEGSGQHPKDRAAQVFRSSEGLGEKHAKVASIANLEFLGTACPLGFKPFAEEVRQRIAPVLTGG